MAATNTDKTRPPVDSIVRYLSRTASAKFLSDIGYPTAPRTLEKLACTGGGPLFRKFGRRAIYAPADLIAWAECRASIPRTQTSQVAA